MLEELGQESTDTWDKIIHDLTIFINKLIADNHEVILLIDTNEPLIPGFRIAKLLQNTNMIDPITLRHGLINIPNTHQSGSDRIDYCFCTDLINNFIKKCAITPYNLFSSADHRDGYLDIQLKIFLRDPFKPTIFPSSWLLTTKKSESVRIHKTILLRYIISNNIILRTNKIQSKIESNTLTTANMTEVNKIYKIITKGMLLAEKSIYFYRSNHPWSPILAKAFLDVQLWKITLSIILNKSQDKKQLTTSLLEWHIIIILQTISIAQTLNKF